MCEIPQRPSVIYVVGASHRLRSMQPQCPLKRQRCQFDDSCTLSWLFQPSPQRGGPACRTSLTSEIVSANRPPVAIAKGASTVERSAPCAARHAKENE